MGHAHKGQCGCRDPVLEAGISGTLNGSPDLAVVPSGEEADATAVVVDLVNDKVLDDRRGIERLFGCGSFG